MIAFAELEDHGLSTRLVNKIEEHLGFLYLEEFLEYAAGLDGVRAVLSRLPNVGPDSIRNFIETVRSFRQPLDDLSMELALAIPDVTECSVVGRVHSRDMLVQMVRGADGELSEKQFCTKATSFVTICRFCEAMCPSDALTGSGVPPAVREDPKQLPPVIISSGKFRRTM